jgi:hypothetical protein
MKKFNYAIMLAINILALSTAMAQKDSSGIYKTADDFKERKLSYAINYKTEKHKIKNNILFNADKIVVKHKGETYNLLKSQTYGFRSTKGEEFRFVDKKEYRVLNPGDTLLIYVYKHPSHSPKETEKYPPMYYFSTHASSAPQSLTKANLKAAFPDSHKFHDALDAQFKSDKELHDYDRFHKMYRLNWIIKNDMN